MFKKFVNGKKTLEKPLDGSGVLPESELPKNLLRELKAVMKEYDELRKKMQMAQEKLNFVHKKIMDYEIQNSVERADREAQAI